MSRGKWYLVYSWRNTFESIGGIWEDREIPLRAITEVFAIAEARLLWSRTINEAKAEWETQKKTFANPPESPFVNGPINPRVVYKISL